MITIKNIFCLYFLLTTTLSACAKSPDSFKKTESEPELKILEPKPNKTSLIKNPLMGWGIYSDAYNPNPSFWKEFDALQIKKYATHLYIRWPWSAFEPSKGQYAWDNDPFLIELINGAKERGLKLAFRVYVDSRDYNSCSTPSYVIDAGAKGIIGNTNQWSPYPDDNIFQSNYAEFVKAFAKRFDNADSVDFVDGFGLGLWGEGHSMILQDDENYDQMYKWIVNLYSETFKNVLVAINYHAEIKKDRLDWAYNEKDYILRHDAFGMGYYYLNFERDMVKSHFPKRPVIAESGWWHNGTNHWQHDDPANYKTWRDVWAQTLKDALEGRANILDLRNISEATSWIQTAPDLVQKFIEEGGYRLYPSKITLPKEIKSDTSFEIQHEWQNLGVGVCPNNLKQWNYKYQIAFAFLNPNTGDIAKLIIDEHADPADWLKGVAKNYTLKVKENNIPAGQYKLALGIIDRTKGNIPALNIALAGSPNKNGWWEMADVSVK